MRLLAYTRIGITAVVLALSGLQYGDAQEIVPPDVDRSPIDVAIGGEGSLLATANQTSSSVSLVHVSSGEVLDERRVGERPEFIEFMPGGKTFLVSCSAAGTVEVLNVENGKLEPKGSIEVGFHPHGLAISRDGRKAYVALTAADKVGVLNLETLSMDATISVGRWPRYLALAADESRLAVGTSGDRGITVVDTSRGETFFKQSFLGINIGHLQASHDGNHVYLPWVIYRQNPITPENIRLGWVLATRVARIRVGEKSRHEGLSLDPPGKAVADPFGLALTSDDSLLAVSAAGTHELLVMRTKELPFDIASTDHLPYELRQDRDKFDRIDLGGRPMGLRIASDDRTAFVANYLKNSIQVVDIVGRCVINEIPLGGAEVPSLERKGESIFYDARRSLDQWYSCHTCHYNGGTNAARMDTMNDGSDFTFKTVLPLYNLRDTGPYTWHGWQQDLQDAMHASLTTTMKGSEPGDDDVGALLAFLNTLKPLPNPHRSSDGALSEAAQRGQAIFEGRAACANCHSGPRFTDGQLHDVGLGSPKDRYPTFNTPTLVGLHERLLLLHDGRTKSLEELLTVAHNPATVSGVEPLTDDERRDLIEYLKSL